MKNRFRGMTLAAVLLSASPSAYADKPATVTDLTPGSGFAGDLSGSAGVHVGSIPTTTSGSAFAKPISNYAAVTIGDLQSTGYQAGDIVAQAGGCNTCDSPSCDGFGCDSMSCGSKNGLGDLLNLCGKDGWIRAEAMLMFMADRNAPALITSNDPGAFTSLDIPGVQTEFGEDLDGGLSGGFRIDAGRYLSKSFGVGGRVLWVGENGDDIFLSGNQNDAAARSIGRPFFSVPLTNPGIAQENAFIVSQLGVNSGETRAEFATDFVMADAYARMTFCKNKQSRLELIGGYTYASLEDMIGVTSSTTDLDAVNTPGFVFSSLFETENRFNGGQIGFDTLITRGRWSARALTKVHLGNMEQTVNIAGSTSDVLAGDIVGTQNSSILVGAEQGEATQDVFTFIPEMDFTLGYRFRDHVSFTVGYTFMYFDNVAMAGDQINRNLDVATLGANVVPVGYDIVEGSHWIQGISLGASIDY